MPHICLSEESFARISAYADTYGMTTEKAVNKAVEHWWEDIAAWSIEDAQKASPRKRRVRRTAVLRLPKVVAAPVPVAVVIPELQVVNR